MKLDDQSIDFLFGVICEAAAHFPPDEHVDTAKNFIRRWREAGLSFETVVLPTIRRMIAKSDDPVTASLGRFDRALMGEAAKINAKANAPPEERPPEPIFEFEDEDKRFIAIREQIAKTLGSARYCAVAHDIRFIANEGKGGEVVNLKGTTFRMHQFKETMTAISMERICKSAGFADFW